jgi:hypothetical protein
MLFPLYADESWNSSKNNPAVLNSIEYLSSITIPSSLTVKTDSMGQAKLAGCRVNIVQAANAERNITGKIIFNIIQPPIMILCVVKLKKIFLNVPFYLLQVLIFAHNYIFCTFFDEIK